MWRRFINGCLSAFFAARSNETFSGIFQGSTVQSLIDRQTFSWNSVSRNFSAVATSLFWSVSRWENRHRSKKKLDWFQRLHKSFPHPGPVRPWDILEVLLMLRLSLWQLNKTHFPWFWFVLKGSESWVGSTPKHFSPFSCDAEGILVSWTVSLFKGQRRSHKTLYTTYVPTKWKLFGPIPLFSKTNKNTQWLPPC